MRAVLPFDLTLRRMSNLSLEFSASILYYVGSNPVVFRRCEVVGTRDGCKVTGIDLIERHLDMEVTGG